jgi:hypothetical protein
MLNGCPACQRNKSKLRSIRPLKWMKVLCRKHKIQLTHIIADIIREKLNETTR